MIHNNTGISKFFYDLFKLKGESSPVFVNDIISPVVDVSPKTTIVKSASAVNATSATIYTTPTDRDFYLTGAMLSTIKDVTAQSTGESIKVFIDGTQVNILTIISITLTVQTDSVSISYDKIKLDRGSTIVVTNGSGVANVSSNGIIFGYIVE